MTRLDNTESELILTLANGVVRWFVDLLGTHEVYGAFWGELNKVQCGLFRSWCEYGLTWTDTKSVTYDDKKRLQVYQGHLPAGGSLRSLLHFTQIHASGNFQLYDFGSAKNWERYGRSDPPHIDLSNVREAGIPIAMYVGNQDLKSTEVDARWAFSEINGGDAPWPIVEYRVINGGHETFLVGSDMGYFSKNVMRLISKYNPRSSSRGRHGVSSSSQDSGSLDLVDELSIKNENNGIA